VLEIQTVDYHTAGEPFRIVTDGAPELQGGSVLERRRWAAEHADHVRRLLVNEPRGHADMYGCFAVPPDGDGADLGAVFFHNAGYSTACGHGTIALVTWAIESGRLPAREEVGVDVASGRLRTWPRVEGGDVKSVRFRNVPAFVLAEGEIPIAFGGAFYAIAEDRVAPGELPRLIERGRAIKRRIEAEREVVHPAQPELHGIYGVIFTEGNRNLTVFADGEVDRSPCGSGTSARLALLHARGELAVGEDYVHESVIGTRFVARVVGAGEDGVITEVEGAAHLTGRHTFVLEDADELGTGFLLR
jgi:proline racemase